MVNSYKEIYNNTISYLTSEECTEPEIKRCGKDYGNRECGEGECCSKYV